MNTKDSSITFRIDQALDDRLKDLAEYHGRTKSDEARRALAIHDAQSTLAYLQTDEAKAELDGRLADVQDQVKSDLRVLVEETCRRSPLPKPPYGDDLN